MSELLVMPDSNFLLKVLSSTNGQPPLYLELSRGELRSTLDDPDTAGALRTLASHTPLTGDRANQFLHDRCHAQLRTLGPDLSTTDLLAAPDPYAEGLKQLRAAAATPESTFEQRWKEDRLAALDAEYQRWNAHVREHPSPRLTDAEEASSSYAPPDPYKAGLDKMRSEGR
jgi:hypothetical protein